jgi:hypothetical protein
MAVLVLNLFAFRMTFLDLLSIYSRALSWELKFRNWSLKCYLVLWTFSRHWKCIRFHFQWWSDICILGDISGGLFGKFYVPIYLAPPDICNVRSRTVSATLCFGGFTRHLRLDFSLMNWQIITGTSGGLLQFLPKFRIVSKIYFDMVSLLLLLIGRLLAHVKFYISGELFISKLY